MTEHRCRGCNKLLFMGDFEGIVEARCPRCYLSNAYQNVPAYTVSRAFSLTGTANKS